MTHIDDIAPLRALIVDADADFRRRLANDLARHGFDALPLERIDEALDSLRSAVPDVLLLSPFLPDGSGLQLIEAFRSDERIFSTLVLALTPNVDGPPRLIAEKCDGFLVKPCSAEQIVERIDRLFHTKDAVAVTEAALALAS